MSENKYGYSTDYVCSNCGSNNFEGTCCMNCGKFVGQSLDEYREGLDELHVDKCSYTQVFWRVI